MPLSAVLPKFSWRHIGGAPERAREAGLRGKARAKCDLTQGKSAGADHLLCGIETSLADIALWRHTHRVGEHPREMELLRWATCARSLMVNSSSRFWSM